MITPTLHYTPGGVWWLKLFFTENWVDGHTLLECSIRFRMRHVTVTQSQRAHNTPCRNMTSPVTGQHDKPTVPRTPARDGQVEHAYKRIDYSVVCHRKLRAWNLHQSAWSETWSIANRFGNDQKCLAHLPAVRITIRFCRHSRRRRARCAISGESGPYITLRIRFPGSKLLLTWTIALLGEAFGLGLETCRNSSWCFCTGAPFSSKRNVQMHYSFIQILTLARASFFTKRERT